VVARLTEVETEKHLLEEVAVEVEAQLLKEEVEECDWKQK